MNPPNKRNSKIANLKMSFNLELLKENIKYKYIFIFDSK